MSKTFRVFLSTAILLTTSATASAGPRTPVINHREHNQQLRIRHGVYTGTLTPAEAARLEAEQARIRLEEARARADGRVTVHERAEIREDLDHANRRIHHQKHD
jgi:hypothetical protein